MNFRIPSLTALLICLSVFGLAAKKRCAAPNGDELAWRALVDISDTSNPNTPRGQSALGWRFWAARNELFPQQGGAPPTQSVFASYRPLNLSCKGSSELAAAHRAAEQQENCEVIFLSPEIASVIVSNQLYWREGLVKYLNGLEAPPFRFSPKAREIKTVWHKLDPKDSSDDYFVAADGDTRYGLVALHLQSHELPDSLWATWVHQDNVGNAEMTDSFGGVGKAFPTKGLTSLLNRHSQRTWLNYRLIGTQVSLTQRTSLGNPLIEGLFSKDLTKVSCMSCHAQAAVAKGNGWWGFNLATPVGQQISLTESLMTTDGDLTLAMAPRCGEVANGTTCTEADLRRPRKIFTARAR